MDSTQINDLFGNNNNVTYKDDEDNIIELNQTNISFYYSHVYVLIKKNDDPIPVEFYNLYINPTIYNDVATKLIIHKVSSKMLQNFYHFNNILLMESEKLNKFNVFNYKLDKKNIVIPILNISYINLIRYLEQFEPVNTLENIFKLCVLNNYFQNNYMNNKKYNYLYNMISNLEESDYWTDYDNCNIYFTDKFKERIFHFNANKIENLFAQDFAKENIKNSDFKKSRFNYYNKSYGGDNYLSMIKYKKYTDISSVLYCRKTHSLLYHISSNIDFSHEDIIQLFKSLDDNQRFLLFCNMLINKKYAHLVINNYTILVMMNPFIKKNASLFSYLLSYTWINFYIEECIKKTHMKTTDNFIFDINTASELPVFPFIHSNPKKNPYMPILVNDIELDPKNNICGIPEYYVDSKPKISKDITCRRIANLNEFKTRMNIFCTRNPDLDLFADFDFCKNKSALSGSIITACLQVEHPLMSQFIGNNFTEKFNKYLDEYYPKSDIDVMFLSCNLLTFIHNAKELYNQIVLNMCKYSSNDNIDINPDHINLESIKNAYLFVSDKFIDKNIITSIQFDSLRDKVDYVEDNIDNIEIYSQFVTYFKKIRQNEIDDFIKDICADELSDLQFNYPEFFDLEDINYDIHIKRGTRYNSESGININYTIKFKITSVYLNHNLELFQINGNDFFTQVCCFHLPCVRGYYDGSSVYLTPSCISAHMTFMNLDYNYFSGTKDPIDIINKYRSRGFGTWLNAAEKKLFIKYSSEIPYWKNMYNITSQMSGDEIIKCITGTLHLNNRFFRPRYFVQDEYIYNNYVDTHNRYYNSTLPITLSSFLDSKSVKNPYYEIYKRKFPELVNLLQINYENINSINAIGCIEPLHKNIINYVYDLINFIKEIN